jgi:dihydroorotase
LLSKSKNTPFDEAILQGKVIATYVGGVNKTESLANA